MNTNQQLDGSELIAAERKRQLEKEGWTPSHDDTHTKGELSVAAAALCVDGTYAWVASIRFRIDPWGLVKKHHRNRVRQLVIAGALIAAEIDRLQRINYQCPVPTDSN